MKAILNLLAWTGGAAAVLYLVLRPDGGAVFTGPMGPIGIGLIGLGMCRMAGKQLPTGA